MTDKERTLLWLIEDGAANMSDRSVLDQLVALGNTQMLVLR